MHHLLAFPLGVLAGLVTGLVPGLHVNLAVFIIIGAGLDAVVPGEAITIFVIALAMTQVLVGFVPAVFLRVPSADNAVATFPGDRLLQRGEGPSAVVAAQTGALYATLAAAVLALVLFLAAPGLLPWLERALKPFLGWVLLAILAWFMVRDLDFAAARAGRWGRFLSHAALAIAGFVLLAQLSEVALSGLPGSPEQGIMAAFSGMFGAATLLASGVAGSRSTAAVAQRPAERIGASAAAVPCALGAAGGTVVGLLPAVGTAEMSAALCAVSDRLMPVATRRLGPDRRYLLMVGAVAAADALLAVAAIFLIGKARSGASIGVEHVLGDRIAASTDGEVRGLLLRLILCGAVASYLAYLAGGWLADAAGRRYSRVDPAAIPRAVSLALLVFVTLTGGPGALLIFLAAASIGILFLRIGLRPASLMAFLLVPSIHFFLGFRLPGLPPVRLETVAIHAIPGTTEALTAIVVAIGVGTCTYGWLARRGGP